MKNYWKWNFIAGALFCVAGASDLYVKSQGSKALGIMFLILGFSQILLGLTNLKKENNQKCDGE